MSDVQTVQQEACAGMATTGPQHIALARFAGTWRADVKLWMNPAAPPQVSHGMMRSHLVLGGKFLQQEYRDDAGMFEGHGFWGYNTVDQRYEGFWIDGMATFFQIEHGQHDAATDTYTMIGSMTDPTSRRPMKKRSVIQYRGPNEHTLEMYFAGPDGRETKAMEIRYARGE